MMGATGYVGRLRECVGHDLLLSPAAAACICDEEGRILLLRRSDGDDLWGFPGGAIEPDERADEAVVREVREETGLHVTPARAGDPFRVELETQVMVVHPVLARVPADVQITLDRENQAYRWIEPREVYNLPHVPQLEDDFIALGLLPG